MFRNILTGAAVIALISGATAQQKQQVSVKKAVTPQYAGTFSPLTGYVGSNNNNRIGTSLTVNNSILSNYYSTPGMNQEWIDNNILEDTDGTGAEAVDGLVYTYCSADANPNGMYEIITMYDDSVYCGGPTAWPFFDCGYGISGLPGGTNGALSCWIVTIDLAGIECNLTDGHGGSAGWGQVWDNAVTGPWLSGGGNGQTNSFTWFDWDVPNANAFQGCYWFGGVPHAGFDMQMYTSGGSGGGVTLSTTGSPGGAMTFDTSGATPGGIVALMYAFGTGSHAQMNPLTGNMVTTGLSSARFTLADISAADGAGNSSYGSGVPSGAAGRVAVQSCDALTDGLSNVVSL
jgi:hypothetical protein